MVDPQDLLNEFAEWSDTKKINFIVALAQDLSADQLAELKIIIASWLD